MLCGKFGSFGGFKQGDKIVYVNGEVWLVSVHYDGCRGWD